MNKEQFIEEVKKLNITLTSKQLNQLDIYASFLQEYNNHTNLTSITETNEIYLKHFYDSMTFVKALKLEGDEKVIDIGTGAGFPGMILKIIYPNISLTLLDSNNKKLDFLEKLSTKLEINDNNYYHGRAEDYALKKRETFDVVTARAVSNMSILTELCLPLVKINGYFIAMKGANQEEINEALYCINILGGEIENNINFQLPYELSERNIVKIKKVKNTPKEYPRRYDKIKKYPLKKNNK